MSGALEEALKFSSNMMTIYVQDSLYVPSDLLGGIIFCCPFSVFTGYCMVTVFWDSCPLVICEKGDPKLSGGFSTTVSDILGSNIPAFWFCHSLMKKVSIGSLPFSPEGFLVYTYFLLFYRGGEN